MKSVIFSLAIIMIAASISSTGFAQPKNKFYKKNLKEKMVEKLNLTEEQENKISGLRSIHQKKMADLKAELEKAKIDLRDLKEDSDLSRNKMISSVEKINEIKNSMAIEKANHRMDVYELLTDEQKEIWRNHKSFGYHSDRKFKDRGFGQNYHKRHGPPEFEND